MQTPVFNVIGSLLKYDVKNENDITPTEKPIIREGHISPPVPETIYPIPLIKKKAIGMDKRYGNHQPLFFNHSNLIGA